MSAARAGQGGGSRGCSVGTGALPGPRCCPGAGSCPPVQPGVLGTGDPKASPNKKGFAFGAVGFTAQCPARGQPRVTLGGHMVALTSALAASVLSRKRGHALALSICSVQPHQRLRIPNSFGLGGP